MFGYIKTDMPNMYVKDTVLYKAMYCGLCKGIGKSCGNCSRLMLNYDLTFLSLFSHNVLGVDVTIEKQRCLVHWLIRRPVAIPDDLTKRIGALNVILGYYKLTDDVIDNNKGKFKRSFFKKNYKKAKKSEQILDKIVQERFNELLEYEKKNSDSIDMVADPFGNMMVDILKEILGAEFNENHREIAYYLGKWIYLIDAIDDFDKDRKKGNFNVFINQTDKNVSKKVYIENNFEELQFIFGDIIEKISKSSKKALSPT